METDFEAEAPKASRTPQRVGVALTATWVVLIAIYAWNNWADVVGMGPNEIGDALAGAAAPLAFLWLVLGFFQQGEELRNSGKALWLQGKELQASVEQQRELVNVTREGIQFESLKLEEQRQEGVRNAQPILRLKPGPNWGGSKGARIHTFRLQNIGKPCTDVVVFIDEHINGTTPHLETGKAHEFNLELVIGGGAEFDVAITYVDAALRNGSTAFSVKQLGHGFEITQTAV